MIYHRAPCGSASISQSDRQTVCQSVRQAVCLSVKSVSLFVPQPRPWQVWFSAVGGAVGVCVHACVGGMGGWKYFGVVRDGVCGRKRSGS